MNFINFREIRVPSKKKDHQINKHLTLEKTNGGTTPLYETPISIPKCYGFMNPVPQ